MLTSLRLTNFRTWVDRHDIPLRPLTLIYGPNSAGKSSMFHAIDLLRTTLEQARGSVVGLTPATDDAQLGDFTNLVSYHDTRRSIEIGVTWESRSTELGTSWMNDAHRAVLLTFTHDQKARARGRLSELTLEVGKEVLTFKPSQGGGFSVSFPGPRMLEWLLADAQEELTVARARQVLTYFSPALAFEFLDGVPSVPMVAESVETADLTQWLLANKSHSWVSALIRNWDSVENLAKQDLPEAGRFDDDPVLLDEQQWLLSAHRVSLNDPHIIGMHMRFSSLLGAVSRELRTELSGFRHIGPARVLPRRVESRSAAPTPDDVGFDGRWVAQVLADPRVLRRTRACVSSFESFPYGIDVVCADMPGAGRPGAPEQGAWRQGDGIDQAICVVLTDRRHDGTEVSVGDVGFGVSQVLPIIVQIAALPPGGMLLVEQPEIHLHPRMQAEMMQLFWAAAIESQGGVQILCETHSETMVRRLMRLLRTAPDNKREALARDSAVLYVLDGPGRIVGGTRYKCIAQMIVDPSPEDIPDEDENPDAYAHFRLQNWPHGFFAEDADEAFARTPPKAARLNEEG